MQSEATHMELKVLYRHGWSRPSIAFRDVAASVHSVPVLLSSQGLPGSHPRADGSVAHAYELGPGWCGGLAVNGVGWMVDSGKVWKQILALSG
jgi:hypothetical protein